MHVYFAQHCFFIPLPHVLVGIQNAAATSKKTKNPACVREIQVRKLRTKVYSQKWLTAMGVAHSMVCDCTCGGVHGMVCDCTCGGVHGMVCECTCGGVHGMVCDCTCGVVHGIVCDYMWGGTWHGV